MELPNLTPTNFEEGSEQPYTIFEPEVFTEDGRQLTAQEVLEEVSEFANAVSKTGYHYHFMSGAASSLEDIREDRAENFTSIVPEGIPDPGAALRGLFINMVDVAERGGFDPERAMVQAKISTTEVDWNPNELLHSDGLFGRIAANSKDYKVARFVYACGPGSLIYPGLDVDKYDAPMIIRDGGQIMFKDRQDNQTLRELDAPSAYEASDEELLEAEAQQVMPGTILAFDPTRTFWHQAPESPRPIIVMDVVQNELHT